MSDETRPDAAMSAQFDMRSPTHRPHLFPADEHTAGQSTAEALQRSQQLYPGRLSPEQRELRDQVRAEQRVAKLLQRLARVGARVLHDRRLPHSAARLDHLVISASGVYLLLRWPPAGAGRCGCSTVTSQSVIGPYFLPRSADAAGPNLPAQCWDGKIEHTSVHRNQQRGQRQYGQTGPFALACSGEHPQHSSKPPRYMRGHDGEVISVA